MLPEFVEVGDEHRLYEISVSRQRQYTPKGTRVLLLVDHARQTVVFGPDAPLDQRGTLLNEAGIELPLGWRHVPVVGDVS
jgi:hypothetical protein